MLRSMLESLVDKSGGKKGLRKELDSQHIQSIENFLKVSFYWPYLIKFSGNMNERTNESIIESMNE